MLLALLLEVHHREVGVEAADARVVADLAEGEDRGEQRVLCDLGGRAALEVLLRDVAPELRLHDDVVCRRARHAEHACVVGGLARERGRGG